MNPDDRLRADREVAFFGRTTAGISHELMNVLATIRESSGLIEDLLALDDSDFPCREKLARTLVTIRSQVDRGMEVSGRLNRLSHCMDDRAAPVKLNGMLGHVASLMQRHADMRQIEVRVTDSQPPAMVQADPVRLLMGLAACIEYCLDRTAGGGVVSLECRRQGEDVAISCRGTPRPDNADDAGDQRHGAPPHSDVMDGVLHVLAPVADPDGPSMVLVLPLAPSSE